MRALEAVSFSDQFLEHVVPHVVIRMDLMFIGDSRNPAVLQQIR